MKSAHSYFNEKAIEYDSAYEKVDNIRSFIFNERRRIVFEMFNLKSGKVLDVGCGPAVYTELLSKRGYEIYGIDSSEKMIEIARNKNYPNTAFFVSDAENLQFADNFFDGVLCVGVLEYLDGSDRCIKEISRVMKRGGIVIITAPNSSSILNVLDSLLRKVISGLHGLLKLRIFNSIYDYKYKSKLLDIRALNKILARNGFEIEKGIFHIFRVSFLNRISPRLSLAIAKKMNFISNRLLGIDYIVKCKKI